MIQDAHPVRSGIPDHYKAIYKIDVVVAASTWTINGERLPSGFNAGGNAFSSTGVAAIVFPAGYKVRGAKAMVAAPTAAVASYRTAHVAAISEANGTANVVITDGGLGGASPALANPIVNSIIFVELDLESV
jgi:hypothetical protein